MTISSSPMPASLAGRRLSRGTQHTVPRTVFLAAITRKRRSNSSGCRERGPCRCQKMIKTSSSVCIRWKRPKQSRSPPRPGLRPPRQPLRRAKQRPPPPAMLVPGRRWAREERASSSASSSVCPSPSPDAPPQAPTRRAPQQNVIRQWPVPAKVGTGHCRLSVDTTSTQRRSRRSHAVVGMRQAQPRGIGTLALSVATSTAFPAVGDRGRNVIVRAREKRPKQSR